MYRIAVLMQMDVGESNTRRQEVCIGRAGGWSETPLEVARYLS